MRYISASEILWGKAPLAVNGADPSIRIPRHVWWGAWVGFGCRRRSVGAGAVPDVARAIKSGVIQAAQQYVTDRRYFEVASQRERDEKEVPACLAGASNRCALTRCADAPAARRGASDLGRQQCVCEAVASPGRAITWTSDLAASNGHRGRLEERMPSGVRLQWALATRDRGAALEAHAGGSKNMTGLNQTMAGDRSIGRSATSTEAERPPFNATLVTLNQGAS